MATAKKAASKTVAAKKAPAAKKADSAATAEGKRSPNAAFMKEMKPSAQLAAVIGDKPMPRTEVVEEYPQIEELFAPVSKKLTSQTLINLNARIDVDGEKPEDVALDWLKDQDFIA